MNRIIAAALLMFSFAAYADSWTSGDKRAHFTSGALLSTGTMVLTKSAGSGFVVGCGFGIGGEFVDAYRYGRHSVHVSAKDATMQCLGAALAAETGVLIMPNGIVWQIKF